MGKIFGSTAALTLAVCGISVAIVLAVVLDFAKTRRGQVASQVEKAQIEKAAEDKADAIRQSHLENQRQIIAAQDKAIAEREAARREAALERLANEPPAKAAPVADKPDADELERQAFMEKQDREQKADRAKQRIQRLLVEQARLKEKVPEALGVLGAPKPKVTPDIKRLSRLLGKIDRPRPVRKFTAAEIAAVEAKRYEREKYEAMQKAAARIN